MGIRLRDSQLFMNPIQRLFGNTTLAFLSRIIIAGSDTVLFIIIARTLGADDAGLFRLGKTFLIIAIAFSSFGLQDLLIRELSIRRDQSGFYLINYISLRLLFALIVYLLLYLALTIFKVPYSSDAITIILVVSLAIFTDSAYAIVEAFFVSHEQFLTPTIAALFIGFIKLLGGIFLLNQGYGITTVIWVIPVGSLVGIIVCIPFLIKYLYRSPQVMPLKFNFKFSVTQLELVVGFALIGIFYTLNAQQDAFIISLYLPERDLGWYGAAQTITTGLLMLSAAIGTVIYPVMSQYYEVDHLKLQFFYKKLYQYFVILILPITLTICLFARPIITLLFNESFLPTVLVLQIMIWELFFTFMHIPNARLMLVSNYQKQLGWIMGIGMFINFLLNLILIPQYGVLGAAINRPLSVFMIFLLAAWFVHRNIFQFNIMPLLIRPFIASILMILVTAVLMNSSMHFIVKALLSIGMYFVVIVLLRSFQVEDSKAWRKLIPK